MGVKLWSLVIANMFVLVLTLLATVAAGPLPSQAPVETPEISQTEDLAVEASSVDTIHSRVPAAVRLPSFLQQMLSPLLLFAVQAMGRDLLITRMKVRPSWVW